LELRLRERVTATAMVTPIVLRRVVVVAMDPLSSA
jgi:hypothetical protein